MPALMAIQPSRADGWIWLSARVKAARIPYFAKIISLCDTYDAITSHRIYDKGTCLDGSLDISFTGVKAFQVDEDRQRIHSLYHLPAGLDCYSFQWRGGDRDRLKSKNKLRPQVFGFEMPTRASGINTK